jgi:hypothetical protein
MKKKKRRKIKVMIINKKINLSIEKRLKNDSDMLDRSTTVILNYSSLP